MSTARHAKYIYIWDDDKDIPFFKLFPLNYRPDTVIYSMFNREGTESADKALLDGVSSQGHIKVFYSGDSERVGTRVFYSGDSERVGTRVFYSGECIMDETHADVVIGFYPPHMIHQPGSVYLRRNVITGTTELIQTADQQKRPPPDKRYIQLRLQELDYITDLFRTKLQGLSSQPPMTPDDILKIRPYSDLNLQWLESRTQEKTKFACFIVSNGACNMRNKFFEMLCKSRKVDSLGRFMRNAPIDFILPDRVKDRHEYLKVIGQYKFMITFENVCLPYYSTEKIYNAFAAGTVPIYWGDPHITEQYNQQAFIHIPTHSTFGDQLAEFIRVIKRLEYLDTHHDAYQAMRAELPCPEAERLDQAVQDAVTAINSI